jgi:hypothetical protein
MCFNILAIIFISILFFELVNGKIGELHPRSIPPLEGGKKDMIVFPPAQAGSRATLRE